MAQRYRAEVADDGSVAPPRPHNLRPLEESPGASSPTKSKSALKSAMKNAPEPAPAPQRGCLKSALKGSGGQPKSQPSSQPAPPAIKSALKGSAPAPPVVKSALKKSTADGDALVPQPPSTDVISARPQSRPGNCFGAIKSALKGGSRGGSAATGSTAPGAVKDNAKSQSAESELRNGNPERGRTSGGTLHKPLQWYVCRSAFQAASTQLQMCMWRVPNENPVEEAGMNRRCSRVDWSLLGKASASTRHSATRLSATRSTTVFFVPEEDDSIFAAIDGEAGDLPVIDGANANAAAAEAGGTGAAKTAEIEAGMNKNVQAASALPDTGGTPPLQTQGRSPLKDMLTSKKVDVEKLRDMLESMSEIRRWIDAPLDLEPPLPTPLWYAVGATLPAVVGLLLEFSADVNTLYGGAKMYNGWIRPGASPVEAVTARKGRFIGTMLGDRLDEILVMLDLASRKASEKKNEEEVKHELEARIDSLQKRQSQERKSIKLVAVHGTIEHTQGHPSEKYDVIQELGEGAFSAVKEAIYRKTGEKRAIKAEMKIEEGAVWEELAVMRKMFHPHVIQLFETFEDCTNIFVVLELCWGGELFDRLATEGGIPERDAARMMGQLASAIDYIHSEQICHRDVQPDNFLLKDNRPLSQATLKLIDFSHAKEFGVGLEMITKICTLHYVAPEILTRKMVPYTEKVDVWSLGVVFFVMLSGAPPFGTSTNLDTLKRIKKGDYAFEPPKVWDNVSTEGKQIISKMLVTNAETRMSAREVVSHEWFCHEHQARQSKFHTQLMSSDQLHNLRTFHARSKLESVKQNLLLQTLPESSFEEISAIFEHHADHDSGKGALPISEVRDQCRVHKNLKAHLEIIMRIVLTVGGGTGKVSLNKFLEASRKRRSALQTEACRAIFDVFDLDSSGSINVAEVRTALLGPLFRDLGLEEIIAFNAKMLEKRLDLGPDEYSFEAFCALAQCDS